MENDEIEKHLERIKQQKVIDEVEIKQAEKMKEKKELGQDYITSASEDENQSEESHYQSSENFQQERSSTKVKEKYSKENSQENIEGINIQLHMPGEKPQAYLKKQRTSLVNNELTVSVVQPSTYDPIKKMVYYLEQHVKASQTH